MRTVGAGRAWRRFRAGVVIVGVVGLAAVVLVLTRGPTGPPLDPASPEPDGGRALARLLSGQGVTVGTAHRHAEVALPPAGARPDGTLLVTDASLVRPEVLRTLAARARTVVLVEPDTPAVRAVSEGAGVAAPTPAGALDTTTRTPGCALDAAVAAGPVTIGGTAHRAARTCYDGALARSGPVTVLGGIRPLTNDALDAAGNAALALRLLGAHERLAWYVPTAGDAALRGGDESLVGQLPRGWVLGTVQAGIAVLLFALWRARRLGPVVTEPLPVRVRAAETVEGRARLYRGAGAADHAAAALRGATVHRLARALGLPPDAPPRAVLDAVGHRTTADAAALLYGPAPADDAELVRLADALDELEREVGS